MSEDPIFDQDDIFGPEDPPFELPELDNFEEFPLEEFPLLDTANFGFPPVRFSSVALPQQNSYNLYWPIVEEDFPFADVDDYRLAMSNLFNAAQEMEQALILHASNVFNTIQSGNPTSDDPIQLESDMVWFNNFSRLCEPEFFGGQLTAYECDSAVQTFDSFALRFFYTPPGGGVL